jgi:hypothetical protein
MLNVFLLLLQAFSRREKKGVGLVYATLRDGPLKQVFDVRNYSGHPSLVSESSLTLALLPCTILTEGTVYYDGIFTDKISLDSDALRSNIIIVNCEWVQ